jgi:hypothetical protein
MKMLSAILLLIIVTPIIVILAFRSDKYDEFKLYGSESAIPEVIKQLLPGYRSAQEWSVNTTTLYTEEEKISNIIENDLNFIGNDSSREKLIKISNYVAAHLDQYNKGGEPVYRAYDMHPAELLTRIDNGETEIYCTHYSRIYTQLAMQAGLPTRVVHSRKESDPDNSEYHHTLVETFLEDEKKWVAVDLQHNNALLFVDEVEQPLSLQELVEEVRNGNSLRAIKANTMEMGEIEGWVVGNYKKYYTNSTLLLLDTRAFKFGLEGIVI